MAQFISANRVSIYPPAVPYFYINVAVIKKSIGCDGEPTLHTAHRPNIQRLWIYFTAHLTVVSDRTSSLFPWSVLGDEATLRPLLTSVAQLLAAESALTDETEGTFTLLPSDKIDVLAMP